MESDNRKSPLTKVFEALILLSVPFAVGTVIGNTVWNFFNHKKESYQEEKKEEKEEEDQKICILNTGIPSSIIIRKYI